MLSRVNQVKYGELLLRLHLFRHVFLGGFGLVFQSFSVVVVVSHAQLSLQSNPTGPLQEKEGWKFQEALNVKYLETAVSALVH